MVYKRQLFFQYSRPSGCDTSKLLSDDLKNKLYYDGFQKMLYHYPHQRKVPRNVSFLVLFFLLYRSVYRTPVQVRAFRVQILN